MRNYSQLGSGRGMPAPQQHVQQQPMLAGSAPPQQQMEQQMAPSLGPMTMTLPGFGGQQPTQQPPMEWQQGRENWLANGGVDSPTGSPQPPMGNSMPPPMPGGGQDGRFAQIAQRFGNRFGQSRRSQQNQMGALSNALRGQQAGPVSMGGPQQPVSNPMLVNGGSAMPGGTMHPGFGESQQPMQPTGGYQPQQPAAGLQQPMNSPFPSAPGGVSAGMRTG